MAVESKDVEEFLSVGTSIMFHTDPVRKDGPRFKTNVRGWRKGNHILLDRPKAANGSFVALQEGQQCVVRYLCEGKACAFDSQVLGWDSRRQSPYLRIRWPQSLQYVTFRKFERIKIHLKCQIEWPTGEHSAACMCDLSIGGCGLHSCHESHVDENIKLSFQLPDGVHVQEVQAKVRNVRALTQRNFLGVEFCENQEAVENEIAFFVTSLLERQRMAGELEAAAHRVLVIDSDPKISARLKQTFEFRKCEVVLATNVVDGMYRLRVAKPSAVIVHQELSDLVGLEVCRIIRECIDFKNTLVYLYGGEDENLEAKAIGVGATGYFPPLLTMAPDIAAGVSQALAKREFNPDLTPV